MLTKDLVILGAGPAGLSATIYANRAALNAVTIEEATWGGQMGTTDIVDNYPGLANISGAELSQKMYDHAQTLGAAISFDTITSIEKDEQGLFCFTGINEQYCSRTAIMASGGSPRQAGFINEERFRGHGVSYCATCDGMFYRDKRCYVVGGGDSACEEADFLTRFASQVILCVRKDHLRAKAHLQHKVAQNPKIDIRYNTQIVALEGQNLPEKIILENTITHEKSALDAEPGSFGVFVFVGNKANSSLARPFCDVNAEGAIITNDCMETKTEGFYAAGDVRAKNLRQIVTAVSDGAIAATQAALYLGEHFQ